MKLNEIIRIANSGKLFVRKVNIGMSSRKKYIWNENNSKILRVDRVIFPKYFCSAYTKEMRNGAVWKISQKGFRELIREGAILE